MSFSIHGRVGFIGRDPMLALAYGPVLTAAPPPLPLPDRPIPCTNCGARHEPPMVHVGDVPYGNRNALLSADRYPYLASRTLGELQGRTFGASFADDIATLPPGALVIDAGGGYSLYGVGLACKGLQVVTINARDFYDDTLKFFEQPQQGEGRWSAKSYALPMVASIFGLSLPPQWNMMSVYLSKDTRGLMAQWMRQVQQQLCSPPLSERFHRRVGYVQQVLPTLRNTRAARLLDVNGAYCYSADRLHLLRLYYGALQVGGKLWLACDRRPDQVVVAGQPQTLFEYLKAQHPDIFHFGHDGAFEYYVITRIREELPHALSALRCLEVDIPEPNAYNDDVPQIRYRVA